MCKSIRTPHRDKRETHRLAVGKVSQQQGRNIRYTRVPWSKITSIGDKLLQFRYFVYSEYFGARYFGKLLVFVVFRVWSLSILFVLGVFWGPILWNTVVLRVFRGSLLWNTRCTWSIWDLVLLLLQFKYSEYLGLHFVLRKFQHSEYFRVLYSKVLRVGVLLEVFNSDGEVFLGSILVILGVLRVIWMFVLRVMLVLEFCFFLFFNHHFYFPAYLVPGRKFYPQRASGQVVGTGVVASPPRYVPLFFVRIGSSIPTARRFSSNVANLRSRAFR